MKTTFYLLLIVLQLCGTNGCAQEIKPVKYAAQSELNYVMANIREGSLRHWVLYDGGLYLSTMKISDPKATPVNTFPEGHEVLESLYVSIAPDGPYVTSTLYKIEALCNLKVLRVEELDYPKLEVVVEYGFINKRKTETFVLRADFD